MAPDLETEPRTPLHQRRRHAHQPTQDLPRLGPLPTRPRGPATPVSDPRPAITANTPKRRTGPPRRRPHRPHLPARSHLNRPRIRHPFPARPAPPRPPRRPAPRRPRRPTPSPRSCSNNQTGTASDAAAPTRALPPTTRNPAAPASAFIYKRGNTYAAARSRSAGRNGRPPPPAPDVGTMTVHASTACYPVAHDPSDPAGGTFLGRRLPRRCSEPVSTRRQTGAPARLSRHGSVLKTGKPQRR
jgi:hypothetical protein